MMKRRVGFSTGSLYKSQNTVQALRTFASAGCTCTELGFVRLNEWDWLDQVTKDHLAPFCYVSFHAPIHDYGQNKITQEILDRLTNFHTTIRALDLVVIHPDPINDFSALAASGLPIGIENMDTRKVSGQTVESLEPIFRRYSEWKMVLDVNHVFTKDPGMGLADKLKHAFRQKIAQVHVSGYSSSHEPLYQTQQTEIMAAAADLDVPIILESVVAPNRVQTELDYVLSYLK